MRVLCYLDGTNVEQVSKAVSTMLRASTMTIGILYVTDTGPQEEMQRHRERFLRHHTLPYAGANRCGKRRRPPHGRFLRREGAIWLVQKRCSVQDDQSEKS